MSDTAPYPKLPEGVPRCPTSETDLATGSYRRCTRTAGHDGEHRMGFWVSSSPNANKVNTPEQDELNAALQARKSDAIAQAAREGATPPALAYSAGAPDYFTIVREAAAQDARRIAAEATLAAARAALRWFTEDGHGIAAAAHFAAAHETKCQLAAAIALADGVNARTEKVDPRDVDPRD